MKPSRVGQNKQLFFGSGKKIDNRKDFKKQCILLSMRLTTAVIPIIKTLVIDILIEATASISGILSYVHVFNIVGMK